MRSELVLVTGGSGFVGAHCIVQLLAGEYRVRTTLRSPAREADVRTMLATAGAEPGDRLAFAVADAKIFTRSYGDQHGDLWSPSGRLLATTTQIAYFKA